MWGLEPPPQISHCHPNATTALPSDERSGWNLPCPGFKSPLCLLPAIAFVESQAFLRLDVSPLENGSGDSWGSMCGRDYLNSMK